MRMLRLTVAAAALLSSLGCGRVACSCLLPYLQVAEHATPGDRILVSASNFGPCCGTTSFPDRPRVRIALARGPHPTGGRVPKTQVVDLDWAVAEVDWDREIMNVTARLPQDLPQGEYFLFLPQAEMITSNEIAVSRTGA